jgi:hypothetical protein
MLSCMNTVATRPIAIERGNDTRILQIRGLDPETYRGMRIEVAAEEYTMATLLKLMWAAYREKTSER